ncbi:MAG: hypothetical protein RLZZ592_1299 [Pseudomonadota bacterium]|jgi:uncharacterized membrane protein
MISAPSSFCLASMPSTTRFARIDALRGLAMVWMTVFHFAFDLNQARWLHPRQNFVDDPFWTVQRVVIVTIFLLCVGLSQAVAREAKVPARRFLRRWGQIVVCALLVSLGSMWMFPSSWISFGVLHAVAVMLLLLRGLPLGAAGWSGLAGVALLLPAFVAHAWFDSPWTRWIGLVTHLPVTQDYVPLLPWLGVAAAGQALGLWLLARHPAVLKGPIPEGRLSQGLAWMGRQALPWYMLHQPVMIGAIWAAGALLR